MPAQTSSNQSQPQYSPAERIIYSCLGFFYATGFVYILFFTQNRWRHFPKRNINWILFRDKIQHWQTWSLHTHPENVEFYKDLIGNILLFIPFPFVLFFFFGIKTFSRLLLTSVASSFCVEMIQYILNIGVADVDDLLLNTIGSLLGILILSAMRTFNRNEQYRVNRNLQTADGN